MSDYDDLRGVDEHLDGLYDRPGLDRDPDERTEEKPRVRDASPVLVRLSDVKPKPVEWLLDGGIPIGNLSLLAGDPGEGKTTLALDIAARVSTGRPMPVGPALTHRPSGVVILTAEDSLENTIRPRLDAHRANSDLVYAVEGVRDEHGHERHLDLGRDLATLEAAIVETRARLVIIDPLSAYLGKTNTWQDSRTRELLTPFAKMADRRGVAMLGLMHLTKAADRRALYRLQGTVGFVAAARAVMLVGTHPEDAARPRTERRRVLVFHKVNSGPERPSVAFRVGGGAIDWCGQVDVTADDLSAPPQRRAAATKKASARQVLAELLADGVWHRSKVIAERVCARVGCGVHVVRNAAAELGVEREDRGYPAEGWMRLPANSGGESPTAEPNVRAACGAESAVGGSENESPTAQTQSQATVTAASPVRESGLSDAQLAMMGVPAEVVATRIRGGFWQGVTADGRYVRIHRRVVEALKERNALALRLR